MGVYGGTGIEQHSLAARSVVILTNSQYGFYTPEKGYKQLTNSPQIQNFV